MRLRTVINRVSRGLQPAPAGREAGSQSSAELADAVERLAREIAAMSPGRAVELLTLVKRGLDTRTEEFDLYVAAEALCAAVYPTYKFSEYGRLFLEDEAFLAYYRSIMDPGNWHSLDRKYTLVQMLKLVGGIDGDIAECGTYKGASALLMCRALAGTTSLVHLFDSFEGLGEPLPVDGGYWQKGSLTTSEAALHRTLHGLDNYRVYKGWIPERFSEVADRAFRFVHIDVDLFEPTLASLEFFYPRLTSGGLVLLDDHGFASCPGAKRAADEFFANKLESIAMLPTGQAFAIKQ
jgi:hypothetical protein